jgi:hypothetical protein
MKTREVIRARRSAANCLDWQVKLDKVTTLFEHLGTAVGRVLGSHEFALSLASDAVARHAIAGTHAESKVAI